MEQFNWFKIKENSKKRLNKTFFKTKCAKSGKNPKSLTKSKSIQSVQLQQIISTKNQFNNKIEYCKTSKIQLIWAKSIKSIKEII